MINLYKIYTVEYRYADQLAIFCFILDFLFRACTQTAMKLFSQMPCVEILRYNYYRVREL